MRKDTNKGLLVLVVVLSLLVLGLSSYLIYDKVLKEDKEIVENNDSSKEEDNSLTDNDKLYSEYLKKLKKNLESFYNENDSEIRINNNFANGNPYSIVIDKKGTLLMSTRNDNYEISNNVLEMFLIDVGNGGYKSLYFIKEDGTLNSFCVDCVLDEGINVKQLENKNIVNVVNSAFGITASGAYGPAFIDIEGNVLFDK